MSRRLAEVKNIFDILQQINHRHTDIVTELTDMPRVANGRPFVGKTPTRPVKRKARKSQALNALEIAEKQGPIETKIQRHRLGEIVDDDDEPRARNEDEDGPSKRRKISQNGDGDLEELDEGSDSDGNKWHMGHDENDEDSDLDSDEAFGESDEEKFADFTFLGSSQTNPAKSKASQQKGLRRDITLSEGEEDDSGDGEEGGFSDEFGSDAVDLATAWDMNDDTDQDKSAKKPKRKWQIQGEEPDSNLNELEGSDEDDDGEDLEDTSQLSFSDDEQDAEARSNLVRFVQGLEGRSESTDKSQTGKSTKLSLETLLAASRYPAHRRALKVVQNREKNGTENYTGGIPGKLAPPLAKRQQDRLDREAAYDKSKETLGRWIDTVKNNRRAEHISFPLPDPGAASALSTKQLIPASQSAPLTSLESTIQEIMQESGLGTRKGKTADDQEQAFEQLQTNKMPIEEVQARRAELRRARDLMFREEIRARRVKKIKSKAYRRVHRKERDRLAQDERALLEREGMINSDDERERDDKLRAETRMGARHRESRWAKAVKASGRAAWDDDARGGVIELARKEEELRRRIEGKKIQESDESGGEVSVSESEYEGFSEEEDNRKLQRKLDALGELSDSIQLPSKLASMAFMQRADASRKKANDEAVAEMKGSLNQDGDSADSDADEAPIENIGRIKYGTQEQKLAIPSPQKVERSEFEERLEPDDSELEQEDTADKTTGTSRHTRTNQVTSAPHLKPSATSKPSKTVVGNPKSANIQQRPSNDTAVQILNEATSSSGSEDESMVSNNPSVPVTRQEEIVRMLFAGDDAVYQDFESEKKETIMEEGDQIIENGLPGWGSWTGDGISKREQRRSKGRTITKVKGVAEDQRKDAKLERVIVNEKRIKKNGKYLATELPHPFESRQQYERSLRLPLGPEWTTKNTFQDATKPRVLVKHGVIRPMAKPTA